MAKDKVSKMRIVNRFSWHKQPGDFAERYFLKRYFKNLGLKFRKIRKDKKGVKPDGYILNNYNERIAIAEIKLIRYNPNRSKTACEILIDETITRSIRKAKKQLKTVGNKLPKIIYLLLDDTFSKFKIVKIAVFGKWITLCKNNCTIYEGYSGLCNKYKENDKLRDNLLTAIICYIQLKDSHKIFCIRNTNSTSMPRQLLDKKHLSELWNYDGKILKRAFPK